MIDHRLHMLQMVAHYGTITAAAEAMRYTPSTVSHQIGRLARELEVTLLEQQGRRVRLTSAARNLLVHVETMDAQWQRARAELDIHTEKVRGTLTLCGFSTAASVLLPATMSSLGTEFPDLSTHAIEAQPVECYDLLLSGEADVAVVMITAETPPRSDPRFTQKHLIEDPLDLLVPHGHPLAGRAGVSLRELSDEPWIIGRPGGTYHHLVTNACVAAGFTPEVAHYADEWETGTALVAAGFGVCLVSRLARWPDQHPVVRIPLRGEHTPARQIAVVTKAGAETRRTLHFALSSLSETASALTESLAVGP